MPTAVLSNQTAFESYTGIDLSMDMPMIAAEWKKRMLSFDGIYTGYLSGVSQVEWVEQFMQEFANPQTKIFVDPVLGDEGVYYRGFCDEMCQAMKKLCGKADVITPNLTEVLFLLGKKADLKAESQNLEQIRNYAKQLSHLGPKTVIITGVSQGEKIWNIGYSAKEDSFFEVSTQKTGEGYSGTGDILTSVICGCMIKGESPQKALKKAAAFLQASIEEAVEDKTDPNEGVAFEHHLSLLFD